MYKNFYGLTQEPFDISPDPRFYYPTQRHNEALASLSYGIGRRKGFIVLTGEAGTGKTLLVRYLLETLTRSNVQYAYVFNPRLSPDDFLRYVLAEFRIPLTSPNRGEMLQQFSRFLIDVQRRGSTATLLIDEAHLLTPDLLEELRLLTNLETSSQKLLQIVLVGQPELDVLLDSPDLRQLKQRVALRCRLLPLGEADVSGYLSRRLQIAGAPRELVDEVFPVSAISRILQYSEGIPRVINTICDNAMLNAYARRERVITADHIENVARDLQLKSQPASPLPSQAPPAAAEDKVPEPIAAAIITPAVDATPLRTNEQPMGSVLGLGQYASEGSAAVTASPAPPPAQGPVVDTDPGSAERSAIEDVPWIAMAPQSVNRLVAITDEAGLGAEKFRALATRLNNAAHSTKLKIVQVTSSVVGEGKTVVASNLAITLAKRSEKKVLLIEGDLRKPAVCTTFGIPPQPGIGDWWNSQERRRRPRPGSDSQNRRSRPINPFLRRFERSNLWLLAAGAVAHPTPILQSALMPELLAQLSTWFDWVVVDTPPLLPMADSNLWARMVDGTLIVVREGMVPRKALQRAIESLDNPKLVGVVLNDAADFDRVGYYGHYAAPAGKSGNTEGSRT